jgi:quinoprotein glucose dehydrogenase
MSADEDLGLLYMGVELPTGDYYGGRAPTCSLKASWRSTSKPASATSDEPPRHLGHGRAVRGNPVDITVNGKAISACANDQAGMGLCADRITGVPVWPIEERPVEKARRASGIRRRSRS